MGRGLPAVNLQGFLTCVPCSSSPLLSWKEVGEGDEEQEVDVWRRGRKMYRRW